MKAITFAAALLVATPADPEPKLPEEVEVAGMQFAIASTCLSLYGEADLFEAAYERFVSAAREHGGLTEAQIQQARIDILANIDDDIEDNIFFRGFCDAIRDDLM